MVVTWGWNGVVPRVEVDSPERFLVEVQFSPGAHYDPFAVAPLKPHVLPVVQRFPLHPGAPSQLGDPPTSLRILCKGVCLQWSHLLCYLITLTTKHA